jgi:hypothetical protein
VDQRALERLGILRLGRVGVDRGIGVDLAADLAGISGRALGHALERRERQLGAVVESQ